MIQCDTERGEAVERSEERFGTARCETCAHCAVSETVMAASGAGRLRFTCMRCPDFVHATQGLAKCNYWEARHAC